MGIPVDILNWFEEDDRCFDYAPVDDETRETLTEMIKIRNIALKSEDYEALKQLKQDLKVVFELGKEMWHIKLFQKKSNLKIPKYRVVLLLMKTSML